jgi:hypothetical protein
VAEIDWHRHLLRFVPQPQETAPTA